MADDKDQTVGGREAADSLQSEMDSTRMDMDPDEIRRGATRTELRIPGVTPVRDSSRSGSFFRPIKGLFGSPRLSFSVRRGSLALVRWIIGIANLVLLLVFSLSLLKQLQIFSAWEFFLPSSVQSLFSQGNILWILLGAVGIFTLWVLGPVTGLARLLLTLLILAGAGVFGWNLAQGLPFGAGPGDDPFLQPAFLFVQVLLPLLVLIHIGGLFAGNRDFSRWPNVSHLLALLVALSLGILQLQTLRLPNLLVLFQNPPLAVGVASVKDNNLNVEVRTKVRRVAGDADSQPRYRFRLSLKKKEGETGAVYSLLASTAAGLPVWNLLKSDLVLQANGKALDRWKIQEMGDIRRVPGKEKVWAQTYEIKLSSLPVAAPEKLSDDVSQTEVQATLPPEGGTDNGLSFVTPTWGEILSKEAEVTLHDSVNGGGPVTLFSDDQPLHDWASAPYTFSWDTRALAPGSHLLSAKGHDTSGAEISDRVLVQVFEGALSVALQNPEKTEAVPQNAPNADQGAVVFLADGSLSLTDTWEGLSKWEWQKNFLTGAALEKSLQDRKAGLVIYGTEPALSGNVCRGASWAAKPADKVSFAKSLDNFKPTGGAALWDGLKKALEQKPTQIVAVIDEAGFCLKEIPPALEKQLGESKVRVDVIALGEIPDFEKNVLKKLTSLTSGSFMLPAKSEQLSELARTIFQERFEVYGNHNLVLTNIADGRPNTLRTGTYTLKMPGLEGLGERSVIVHRGFVTELTVKSVENGYALEERLSKGEPAPPSAGVSEP